MEPDSSSDQSSKENRQELVWRNGRLLSAKEGGVTAFDHGLLTGDGVFETLVARDGVIFAETRHYLRLVRSAAAMGLDSPGQEELATAMREVLQANQLLQGEMRVRITLTGGDSPLGSARGEAEQTVLVAASPSPLFPDRVVVVTVPYARNDQGALAGVKTISYGENVVALRYAKQRGAGEAIFGNTRGLLCEGTGTNVFAVFDGKLMTPPLSSGCLAGITRSVVLDVCGREGIEVSERDVPLTELQNADEAFLTSTLRHVQAVESVDGIALGSGRALLSTRIREAFLDFAAEEPDPAPLS